MTTVEELIIEMQDTKAAHPTLELSDILRLYTIQVLRELTKQLDLLRQNG